MDKYSSMVQKLVSLSIKLVAVDFDQTIINIHTRGCWQFTSKSLISRVRPSFKQFFTAMLNCRDLHVAVVTHSPQIPLIREVLEQALPECDTSRIHYRGTDGKWKEVKGVTKEGKQQHIESVLNQIEKDHKVKIKSEEVILLDDDEENISVARSCKMRALLIKGDDSLDELLEQRCAVSLAVTCNQAFFPHSPKPDHRFLLQPLFGLSCDACGEALCDNQNNDCHEDSVHVVGVWRDSI